jgi:hypothetical protein
MQNSDSPKKKNEKSDKLSFKEALLAALEDMFNGCAIEEKADSNEITIKMDTKLIKIDHKLSSVKCEDDKQLEHIITNVLNQVKNLSL